MNVYIDGLHVGDLVIRERSSTFMYSALWMKNGFPVSPDMPLHVKDHHAAGVHGIFSDASPDRWGRKLIERKIGRARVSEQDYILGVSDRLRLGALCFSLDGGKTFESKEDKIPPLSSLPKFIHLTEAIMKGEDHDYSELISNASLGGARAKIIVVDKNRQWIAKVPQIHDQDDVEGWEYVCLKLADETGINVPECSLHGDKFNHTLLIKRFDRKANKKIHYMSAMTLMGLKDGDQCSYTDLAFEITDKIGPECLAELYRRMLLNIMVSNTDDHLRNHGFLYQDGWKLSPAFDITISNRPYGAPHALRLNAEDKDDFTTALLISEYFGLSRKKAIIILSDMIEKVSKRWRAVATTAGLSNIDSMAESIFIKEALDTIKHIS